MRASSRTRDPEVAITPSEGVLAADTVQQEDLAGRLRQLVFYLAVLLGGLGFAWVWELDLALIRFLANQPLLSLSDTPVTLGDLAKSAIAILLGSVAWRYMSTLFALTLFPRIADDPGVRFAVVTLCRYVVLGVTSIAARWGPSTSAKRRSAWSWPPWAWAWGSVFKRSFPTSSAGSSCFWNGRSGSATS